MPGSESSRTSASPRLTRSCSSSHRHCAAKSKRSAVVVEGTGEGRSDARIITVQVSARDRLEAAKSLLKRYPMQLDAKEQKLKLQKLENEIRAATESNQAAGKEPLVRIYLPDNGRGDNA